MKRGLPYILGGIIFLETLITPTPVYSGEKRWKDKAREAYGKVERWIEKGQRIPTAKERMKGAETAGKILENITGIPGISRSVKIIEKKVTDSGYYDRQQKRRNNRYRK